jgi:hypothetical protein
VILPALTGQAVQDANDFVEVGHYMRLSPPQRGHAQPGQLFLQGPQVGGPKSQVMRQVAGAGLLVRAELRNRSGIPVLRRLQRFAQGPELFEEH